MATVSPIWIGAKRARVNGSEYHGPTKLLVDSPVIACSAGIASKRAKVNAVPLIRLSADPKLPAEIGSLEGSWEGTICVSDLAKLRLVLQLSHSQAGPLIGTLSTPEQNVIGLQIQSMTFQEGTLRFRLSKLGAEFAGTLEPSGMAIAGQWRQSGNVFPVILAKVDPIAGRHSRPQTPTRPLRHPEEEVTYKSDAGKTKLAGTLTVPAIRGKHPAVILISGSGPQDRDSTLWGHKPFLVLADYLANLGIATLRVDDRGVGASTGDTWTATSADLADDVLQGVCFLARRHDIDPQHIGLLGYSEGGLVGAIAATRSEKISFLVMIGTPGLPLEQVLETQRRHVRRRAHTPRDTTHWEEQLVGSLLDVIKTETDARQTMAAMQMVIQRALTELPATEATRLEQVRAIVEAQATLIRTPWFRFLLSVDPRALLHRVECPVLAVNGTRDWQVDAKSNLMEIERALRAGGNDHVAIKRLRNLNHILQTTRNGELSDYADIQETIAPTALKLIGNWIAQQARI